MSLSAILTEAFHFFRNHIRQLAMLMMPLLLVQVGMQLWLGTEFSAMNLEKPEFAASHFVVMMVLLLIFSLLIASLTLYLDVRSQGHEPTTGQVMKASIAFVPPLLLAGVFSALAILAPVMILAAFGPFGVIGFGISLYIFARLSYVNFMVITERLTPLEAIKASFKMSGPIVLKTLAIVGLYIPISLVGGSLSQLASNLGLPVQLVVETLVAFVGLFVNIALFRLYMINRPIQNEESK
ncbi:hypothetical protein D5R81_18595 [Parashewanella spongiae]|uniref:Uncharacterized protein n=1 Tax=Parashewanella spongiae TaxID=342950 RepID=A0A3A6TUR3_9GAMM|nr:hypothetical protein [Parashewanella spongiae]MCL1080124.1 hypothetical protein [Parashewanella spongiae]RJY05223.1 hypothetical protein D5R81_18595 [Parashewanella spongiae]